jgi:hypothetical protein
MEIRTSHLTRHDESFSFPDWRAMILAQSAPSAENIETSSAGSSSDAASVLAGDGYLHMSPFSNKAKISATYGIIAHLLPASLYDLVVIVAGKRWTAKRFA